MKISVKSITQPLVRTEDDVRFLTPEEFIVYTARVSNPSNQLNTLSASKLIKYCINHEHWSVFEQADMTLEIVTSRDISAQIIRHKSFSFQEFSQRYSAVTNLESFDIRKQAEKNRQSSEEILDLPEEDIQKITTYLQAGMDLYDYLLKKGAARESARKILPLCAQTTLYMKGSIRSWIHYIMLRSKKETQLEHREIAITAGKILQKTFPAVFEALEEIKTEAEEFEKWKANPHYQCNEHPQTSPSREGLKIAPTQEEIRKTLVDNGTYIL